MTPTIRVGIENWTLFLEPDKQSSLHYPDTDGRFLVAYGKGETEGLDVMIDAEVQFRRATVNKRNAGDAIYWVNDFGEAHHLHVNAFLPPDLWDELKSTALMPNAKSVFFCGILNRSGRLTPNEKSKISSPQVLIKFMLDK